MIGKKQSKREGTVFRVSANFEVGNVTSRIPIPRNAPPRVSMAFIVREIRRPPRLSLLHLEASRFATALLFRRLRFPSGDGNEMPVDPVQKLR
jgi:hypothetical protein